MHDVSPHVNSFISPLANETAALLKEDNFLAERDYLHIEMAAKDERLLVLLPRSRDLTRGPSDWATSMDGWAKRIPGVARLTGLRSGFKAAATDTTAMILMAVWGKDRITFENDIAKFEFWTNFGSFVKLNKIAEAVARFRIQGILPDNAPLGNPIPGLEPMTHQRMEAWCMLNTPDGYGIWGEQGTGKTYPVIMTFDEEAKARKHLLHLLICPKNVRHNWEHELRTFSTCNVRTVIFEGLKLDRKKLLLTAFEYRKDYDYTVVISSYNLLSTTLAQLSAFRWHWGICDESHFFASAKVQRFADILELRGSCSKRASLTGTPICNSQTDLYSQFEWMDKGASGFQSPKAFKAFHGTFKPATKGYVALEESLTAKPTAMLKERIARRAFVISKKEALPELPDVTYSMVEAEMSAAQKDVYKKLAEELYAQIEQDIEQSDNLAITANNALTRLLRLAQITAGFYALDAEIDIDTGKVISREIRYFDPDPKLEQLIEIVKELPPTSKFIVWTCWVPPIAKISSRLTAEGFDNVTFYGQTSDRDRAIALDRFNNDPLCRGWVGNPRAGGIGTNLLGRCNDIHGRNTMQCDTMIHHSSNWSSAVRRQADGRHHRKGTEWPVRVIDLCVVNSIDFDIRDRVMDKIVHALEIQNVRSILQRMIAA